MYILGKGKWTKVTIAMGLSAFLLFSQIAMAMPRTMQEANVPFKGKLILPVVIKKVNPVSTATAPSRGKTAAATNTAFIPTRVLKAGISGDDVKQLQMLLQKLGFFTGKIDGKFGASTQSAVIAFQKAAAIKASGLVAELTVNKLNSKGAPSRKSSTRTIVVATPKTAVHQTTVSKSIPVPTSTNENKPIQEVPKGSVEMLDWSQVNGLFAHKSTARMTDVDTGKSIIVYRYGGQNHADVEPLTAQDTAILKEMYGGIITSYRRAVIVEINGHRIAASIYGVPHGGENILNNDFAGQFCMHFLGSKTHNSNRMDPDQQAMVRKAGAVQ